MVRVVAGHLREPDPDGRGPDDVAKWQEIVKDLEQVLVENPKLRVDGYQRPMLAFELSVKRMDVHEKQLLAVLRHFAPVKAVATAVVEVVWRGLWSTSANFKRLLQKLMRINVVDIHQQDYYGFEYGVLFISSSTLGTRVLLIEGG